MITLKKIPRFERSLIDLYKKAFPKNERKPIFLIDLLIKRNKCEFLTILNDDVSVGFFIVLKDDNLVLVDYFAIKQDKRNMGYGATALVELKKFYNNKRIVLEIECVGMGAQNEDLRIRRRNFYLRNGFTTTSVELYIYKERMELIYNEEAYPVPSFDEYSMLLKKVLGKILYNAVNPTKI